MLQTEIVCRWIESVGLRLHPSITDKIVAQNDPGFSWYQGANTTHVSTKIQHVSTCFTGCVNTCLVANHNVDKPAVTTLGIVKA